MNQTFFKIAFDDRDIIDYDMFREINEVIAKIRFEGYGKVLAPRYEYYNGGIVNDLANKMYVALYVLHGDGEELKKILKNGLEGLGYKCSFELKMPDYVEIFYNASKLDDSIKFDSEFKAKITESGGVVERQSNLKNNYDSTVTFRLQCQMDDFDEKVNGILSFLKMNIGEEYFIEYF